MGKSLHIVLHLHEQQKKISSALFFSYKIIALFYIQAIYRKLVLLHHKMVLLPVTRVVSD